MSMFNCANINASFTKVLTCLSGITFICIILWSVKILQASKAISESHSALTPIWENYFYGSVDGDLLGDGNDLFAGYGQGLMWYDTMTGEAIDKIYLGEVAHQILYEPPYLYVTTSDKFFVIEKEARLHNRASLHVPDQTTRIYAIEDGVTFSGRRLSSTTETLLIWQYNPITNRIDTLWADDRAIRSALVADGLIYVTVDNGDGTDRVEIWEYDHATQTLQTISSFALTTTGIVMAQKNNVVYVRQNYVELVAISMQDFANPTLVSSFEYDQSQILQAYRTTNRLYLQGEYIANELPCPISGCIMSDKELIVLDISDPENLIFVERGYGFGRYNEIHGSIWVNVDESILTMYGLNGGVPHLLSRTTDSAYYPMGLAVSEERLFVVESQWGVGGEIMVFNSENPNNIYAVDEYNQMGRINDVVAYDEDTFIFSSDPFYPLVTIADLNTSDGSPLLTEYQPACLSPCGGVRFAQAQDGLLYLLVNGYDPEFFVSYFLDIAMLNGDQPPTTVNRVRLDIAPDNFCCAAEVQDGYLYMGVANGMIVLDIQDPQEPSQVSFTAIPSYSFKDIIVSGDWIYLLADHELYVLDVSDKTNPILMPNSAPAFLGSSMALHDNYLYMAEYEAVTIYHLTTPSTLQQVGSYPHSRSGYAGSIQAENNLLFTSDREEDVINILDISQPITPTLVTTLPKAGDIAVSGNRVMVAYVTEGANSWLLFDGLYTTYLPVIRHDR